MEKRNRNVTLSIRLTPKEKWEILSKARQANLPINKYIIACSDRLQIDCTDYRPVITELKRIGNNLNQIARRLNSGGALPHDFAEVVEGQRKIYDLILEKMR